uniref:Sushi domain containing 1 n=1 Tax=Amphilophus citrinellus TaxID=61819 RepID=A0A3Q0RLC4_AMPCI
HHRICWHAGSWKKLVEVLSILSGKPAEGQIPLDVCSTCHANATCDDKSDGSGKVCNCKYGFVGNGRTFCQDKDECQIGANKICGLHTTCHNTYGSYYCTCLAGYSPSNNMAVFIPNDGTHCQDIDECRITGQCGEGAQCRNLNGSFDCSCQVGYKIHNGVEPFHPLRDKASCKEVDCGSPPAFPHSHLLWNKNTKMGTKVVYQCNSGYHNVGKGNVSICTAGGQWARPSMLCQEILCGSPPVIEFTEQAWSNNSTPGSTVLYFCKEGFYNNGGNNVSICQENGQWTPPTLSCQGNQAADCFHIQLKWMIAEFSHLANCCGKTLWLECSLNPTKCIFSPTEIKPSIHHLLIFNESCLRWKAEKYEEDTEVYKVTYTGSRDYQRYFYDKRKKFLSSKADRLELCLSLLPVTNYSIAVTATSARFTATITISTSLPVVYYREFDTPLPVLSLWRSPNTLDPISLYQVFVLPGEGIMMFNCSCPAKATPTSKVNSPAEYITAQFDVHYVGTEMNFTIGDGLLYGGFYNAPLESGKNYYIILRTVSQWKTVSVAILW